MDKRIAIKVANLGHSSSWMVAILYYGVVIFLRTRQSSLDNRDVGHVNGTNVP